MKSSFKNYLHTYIKSKKGAMVRLSTIHKLAEKYGCKQRTAERILNFSQSGGEVITIYNSKNHVIGYVWAGDLTIYK